MELLRLGKFQIRPMPLSSLSSLRSALLASAALLSVAAFAAAGAPKSAAATRQPPEDPAITQRNDAYAKQLESHLLHWLVEEYPARAAQAWHRDYGSLDAFERSVAPNRERWRQFLKPPVLP